MKTITNAIEALASNVSRHAAVYAAARPNHPALAPYESIAEVLAALVDRSRLTADERDPILIAVVTEHQRTRHALWQSLRNRCTTTRPSASPSSAASSRA